MCRTDVVLSIAGTECARLACVQDFRHGCGQLQRAFQEQERGQKRRERAGYHHGYPACMCYRCDSLAGPDPGSSLAIYLNDGDDFSCGCSGGKICRLGGSRSCVLAIVGMRHRGQAVPSSGFKQPLALMKGCLQCLKEWVSSWQPRQSPRFSRRASARVEGERRPLQRGGSSVLNKALTAKTIA